MSKEHLNYLRRKTADEAELWAADRIEELEGANILNSNALRLQKKKCDALRAEIAELVAYLDANYGFMRCGNAADNLPIGTKLYAIKGPKP